MSSNGLYGYSNGNVVNVSNTTGLYIGSGNVSVLNNAETLYNLLANSSSIGFYLTNSNLDVAATTLPTGVTSGTYGSTSLIPVVTVGTDGRVTSVSTVTIPTQTGTYSNTNVAAYLTGTVTVGNLITTAGVYWSNGQPYSSGNNTIYGNANVVALLGAFGSNSISTTGNVTAGNVLSNNYLYANGVSILTGISGTYSNTNVAAYLTTATITTTGNITGANLTTAGNVTAAYVKGNGSLLTNLPTQPGTYSNTNVTAYLAGTVSVGNIASTNGYFWANGTAYSTGISGTYSNTNVAAYLTTATINTTGNVTGANLITAGNVYGAYHIGNGALLTNLPTQAGTYSNTNVAAYLTTATINTTGNITGANLVTAGNVYGAYHIGNGALLTNLPTQAGTYSNTNVTAYLTTATISTTGNITGANLVTAGNVYGAYHIGNGALLTNLPVQTGTYSNTNVTAYLTTATITTTGNVTGANLTTAGNVTASYVKGDGSLLTNLPVQTGTYSNTNVTAYLTTATISTTGNVTGANLTTAGNVTASYIKGNGSLLTNLPSSTVTLTGNVTGSGQTGTNINTLIAASGVTPGTYGADNAVPVITVAADGRITTLTTTPIGSGGSAYGNANVQAYLPTYTGAMPNLTSINTSANITANTGGYFVGDGSKLTNLPVQPGTYTNSNVTNLLSGGTYSGDINAPTGVVTAAAINSTGAITASSYVQAAQGVYSIGTFSGTYSDGIVVDYVTGNGRISVGTADNVTFYIGGVGATPTLQIAANGAAVAGNLITTNGVYWSNGAPYSTGGGGGVTSITAGTGITANASTGAISLTNSGVTAIVAGTGITANASTGVVSISASGGGGSFTGNLAGNVLYDGVNKRVNINAYPLSSPSFTTASGNPLPSTGAYGYLNNTPVYTNGVLQAPAAPIFTSVTGGEVFGELVSSNIALQSSYQTSTTRAAVGQMNYNQVWPTTANNMTSSDRLFAGAQLTDVVLTNGVKWPSTTAALTTNNIVNQYNLINIVGNGAAGTVVGVKSTISTAPSSGGQANVTYAASYYAQLQANSAVTSTTGFQSNVTTWYGYTGSLLGTLNAYCNLGSAVMYHVPSNWAPATGSNLGSKYAFYNQDGSALVSSASGFAVSGNGSGITFFDNTTQTTAYVANILSANVFPQTTFLSNGASQTINITAANQYTIVDGGAYNFSANTLTLNFCEPGNTSAPPLGTLFNVAFRNFTGGSNFPTLAYQDGGSAIYPTPSGPGVIPTDGSNFYFTIQFAGGGGYAGMNIFSDTSPPPQYLISTPSSASTYSINTVISSNSGLTPGVYELNLNQNASLSLTMTAGQTITLVIKQDSTGGWALTWPSGCKFAGGSSSLTGTANSIDIATVFTDAYGVYYVTIVKGYA